MTDRHRARLRVKQDFLLMLVVDMGGMAEALHVTEGGPTLADMRRFVYPEWEGHVDRLVAYWAEEHHVGLPNWERVTDLATA
jgi:hypothetical protein